MKQVNMFAPDSSAAESMYTGKINAPVYEIKGDCPKVEDLYDTTKADKLIDRICNVTVNKDLTNDEAQFLVDSAKRHVVFNYEKIAEYYAHASPEMRSLMEKSALVIIGFEKAIQYGYIKSCKTLKKKFLEHDAE
jgi:hypothetical protein